MSKFSKSGVAPLVQTDINELGDKRLNPEEAVAREREELLRMASNRKIHGQQELEDKERSSGARLSYQELIAKLTRCNPSLYFTDGSANQIAVYRPKNRVELSESDYDYEKQSWWNHHTYVTGFAKEPTREWGHVTVDTSEIAEREVRGWRSVLMALIKTGAITYASAVKEFGEPQDRRSTRWHEQLRIYKYRSSK